MANTAVSERIFTSNFIWTCVSNLTSFCGFYGMMAALPVYLALIGAKESDIGIVVGAFAVTSVVARLFVGGMVGKRGTRNLMMLGAAIMLIASCLFATTENLTLMLIIRLFQGVGFGITGTSANILVTQIAPVSRRGEALGYFGVSTNLAMAIGPSIGVMLASSFGYVAMFLTLAFFCLIAVWGALATHDHPAPMVAEPPVFDWRNYLTPAAFFPAAILCAFTLTYSSLVAFLPLLVEERQLGNAGLFFTLYAVGLIIVRGPAGRLSDRVGRGIVVVPGLLAQALALFMLSSVSSLPVMLFAALLYGFGAAAIMPALQAMAVDRAGPERRSGATGTYLMAFDLGVGVGSFFWGFVVQAVGFELVYIFCSLLAVVGVIGLIAGGGLRRTLPKDVVAPRQQA